MDRTERVRRDACADPRRRVAQQPGSEHDRHIGEPRRARALSRRGRCAVEAAVVGDLAMRSNPLAYLDVELNDLRSQGLYRPLRVLDAEQKAHTSIDHRSVVNLSSNNYLGLTTHPRLRERAREALDTLGVGTGSVRTIAGTMAIHVELERRLAAFKKTEAAVVFQSGFTANAGTVSSLLGRDDVIVSDELNHASIIDGARLSRATIKVFPHRDVAAARAILQRLPRQQRTLIITDGVFSMDGDLGALPGLCDLADEFGCIMMVDDAPGRGGVGAAAA